MEFTDEDIIAELKALTQQRESYFAGIYNRYFSLVEAYVLKNSGSTDDAKDVFQEVVIILLGKINEKDFALTSSVATYIYAISRNIWLSKLKENSRFPTSQLPEDVHGEMPCENKNDRENSLVRWISRITEHCQQIIKSLFFLLEPIEVVATRLGWKNRHTAQNQKYKCIQQIKKVKEKEEGAASQL